MKFKYITIFLICFSIPSIAQLKTAILKGKILDINSKPIEDVLVSEPTLNIGMQTKIDGSFELTLPSNKYLNITIFKSGYKQLEYTYRLIDNESKNISITLPASKSLLNTFVKTATRNRVDAGNVKINIQQAGIMPSTIGGIEGLLKVFLSGNNNELTSQYNVRGGNFDENLVYINDFEVYRPFLVRSGQQEGLSVINSDMVNNVNFSTGGFQAKYGDKMSSVLDVQYRKPKKFAGSFYASLLGAGLELEGISKNNKLSYMVGVRQKSNQYLLGAQQTSGVYNPSFTDMQAVINYNINKKWNMEILGNYARNRFHFIPEELNSSFGLINKALNLNIRYQGSETDQFDSRFAGISFSKSVNEKLNIKFLASGFQTNEFETYDLNGEYILGEIETDLGKDNFGQVKYALGTGIIHTFARNYLTMNVANIGHKGSYDLNKHFLQWGVNANTTNINDKLNEWRRIDSAGYSQPASTTELNMAYNFKAQNNISYQVFSGFVQDNFAIDTNLSLTYGVRFNYDNLNKEFLVSPRVQANWKPKHWKQDAILRGAIGLYQQPPFYRELRNYQGVINSNELAQKSAHIVLGTDYNFKKWERPFKLTAETYYKQLWDLVPYEYDNVRIRYWGRNDSKGYATGAEMRLYGDIVKGAESWVSMGVMKTAENILDDVGYKYNSTGQITDSFSPGYIPRPTDSRFTFGLFFQDYFPTNKNIKVHINGMYGTGLPYGPADNNRYGDTLRLPSYRRVDIGFSALLVDGEKKNKPYYSLFHKLSSIWLSAEVFNLLDIKNTISYQWIQDRSSGRTYAVPNHLTGRMLNLKLLVKF